MKLKAPQGVGDPCVAGVRILPRDGLYEVEAEIGALLIECFGVVSVALEQSRKVARVPRHGRAASNRAKTGD